MIGGNPMEEETRKEFLELLKLIDKGRDIRKIAVDRSKADICNLVELFQFQ